MTLAPTRRRELTNPDTTENDLAISGDHVVWTGLVRVGHGDIYLYDIGTGTTEQLTNNDQLIGGPTISGNRVVWSGSVDG